MPKIAKERTQENQRRVEAAALELFTRQGFHGTNNREIAEKLGTSTGAIYTYFPSKEAIFASLAQRYREHIRAWFNQTIRALTDPLSKGDLKKFASAIHAKMCDEPEYLLMLLSDVIEFQNQHFLETFHDMPEQLRRLLGPVLEQMEQQPGWRGEDPAFVLASVYLYFFTYTLIERHMQGEQPLGVSNEQASEHLVDLLSRGLWASAPGAQGERPPRTGEYFAKQQALHQASRERIGYIRFLSGRLWNSPPDLPPSHAEKDNGGHPARRPILFLPEIPRDRIDENQLRIEAAALELFTRQGFHGTNIRDIAEKAEVSQGAIYMYYSSKQAIFADLARTYRRTMRKFMERVFRALEDPFSQDGLRLFAAAIRSMVYDDAEYWLLMYIDVIEFKNQHFAGVSRDIPEQFRRLLGPAAGRIKMRPGWCGQDPALAMAMIYVYFHTYFAIERLMHGNRHLGISDDEAIERFIDLLSNGLWSSPPPSS